MCSWESLFGTLVSLNKLRLSVPTLGVLSSVASSLYQTSASIDGRALAALVNCGAVFTLVYFSSVRTSAQRCCSFAVL